MVLALVLSSYNLGIVISRFLAQVANYMTEGAPPPELGKTDLEKIRSVLVKTGLK